MTMTKLLARIAFSTVLLQSVLFAAAGQEPAQDYGWDCPGSGYLSFRKELLVSTEELARLLDAGEVTVIHVGFDGSRAAELRRPTYAHGHVPGARHLPWSDLQGTTGLLRPAASRWSALAALGISPGRRVVLYDTGLGLEAAAALVALESVGLADRAALLDGQWVKWAFEGRPLCRWGEQAEPSDLESRLADLGPSREELERLMRDAGEPRPSITLIDARTGPDLGRRLGSPSRHQRMPWTGNLASLSLPVFKGEAELRRLWANVPARADHRVVVGGRDWKEAAPVYFVARLLGYSVEIFDGSIDDLESAPATLERGS
jgi:thiosulfate/3-mercaptopyruvate sulfurtransferase